MLNARLLMIVIVSKSITEANTLIEVQYVESCAEDNRYIFEAIFDDE